MLNFRDGEYNEFVGTEEREISIEEANEFGVKIETDDYENDMD